MAVLAQQSRSAADRNSAKPSSPVASRAISPSPGTPKASRRGPMSGESLNPDRSVYDRSASSSNSAAQPRRSTPARKGEADRAGGQSMPEAEILFQKYFKSVGPRTYAAQLKRANNGNHFLVLTEAKRDDKTNDVRKTRLFLFSEDFVSFFRMLHETAQFIRQNPVPDEVRKRRAQHWSKKSAGERRSPPGSPAGTRSR